MELEPRLKLRIITLHRSTMYLHAAYYAIVADGITWFVGLSVTLSVCHTSEPCKNGRSDRVAV